MSHNGALYVQVRGSLYKIPLPVKTLTAPTREEKQNKFSVLRIEHNKYITGDSSSTWGVFTFVSQSNFEQREVLAVVSEQASIQFFDAKVESQIGDELVVPANIESNFVNCRVLACAKQRILFSGIKNGVYTIVMIQVESDFTIKEIALYTPDSHYNSICGASCTGNDVLLLHKEATNFKVSRLSSLSKPKTLPVRSEQQALFITESSSLVIADNLSNPNFQADGTLKEEIENRLRSEQQSFQDTIKVLEKFVSKPIPYHSELMTEKSSHTDVLKQQQTRLDRLRVLAETFVSKLETQASHNQVLTGQEYFTKDDQKAISCVRGISGCIDKLQKIVFAFTNLIDLDLIQRCNHYYSNLKERFNPRGFTVLKEILNQISNSAQIIANLPLTSIRDYLDLLDCDQSIDMVASFSCIQYHVVMINESLEQPIQDISIPANTI